MINRKQINYLVSEISATVLRHWTRSRSCETVNSLSCLYSV